jgi:hypothetical protein
MTCTCKAEHWQPHAQACPLYKPPSDRLTRIRAGGAIGVADAEWLLGEFERLRAALNDAGYALFRIKRMPCTESIVAFATAEHTKVCAILDGVAAEPNSPPPGEAVLPGRLGHTPWCQHRIDVERLQGLPPRPCNCGATVKSVSEPGASPLCDGEVRVIYEHGEPHGVRDVSGYLCHFNRVPKFEGQEERYRRELALRARQAEAIATALRSDLKSPAEPAVPDFSDPAGFERLAKAIAEPGECRDTIRYHWLRDWILRDGRRAEIDPDGHIAVRTLPEWEALLDAAIARGAAQKSGACLPPCECLLLDKEPSAYHALKCPRYVADAL